jgi:PST family polysaccharide transporter
LKPFDKNGEFIEAENASGLTVRAVRGAGVTVFSGTMGLAIQLIATVTLTRLLTPHDFGLLAVVTTFSLLLTNFGVNGITEAVLQRQRLNHALASNLFWINVTGGLLLSIGFAATGSVLAWCYGDPLLTSVTAWISTTILITSTSVQHLALLKRAMRFSVVSANDVVARTVSVAVSILLSWEGWGYWALVAGVIAMALSTSIGAWSLCRWAPGRPRRATGTASMVSFAMHTYGRFTLNYCTRNTDNVLVAWRYGTVSLGFYKKAYDLFALSAGQLVASLTEVALSALSRLDPRSAQYRQHVLSALSILALVGMGLAANLTLVGRDLIRLLLGAAWQPAGRIFTYFAPGIGAMLIYYTHGWVHLSIGRADRWFRWGFVEVGVTILFFLLALPWGPEGIAVAWAASFWVLAIPALWYAGRPIAFGVAPMLNVVWKYILAAALAGYVSTVVISGMLPSGEVSGPIAAARRIIATSLLFEALYLSMVILLHRSFDPIRRVIQLAGKMVRLPVPAAPKPQAAPVTAYARETGNMLISHDAFTNAARAVRVRKTT